MSTSLALQGAGLGLRRSMLPELLGMGAGAVDFLECAPDNWISVGGAYGENLARLAERYPLACHGLSLSLGGPAPLDHDFLRRIRSFLNRYHVPLFSEHLSYCSDDGHLYDLIPMPFTDEAVHHIAGRIREVQDALGRRIAVENISYYAAPYQAMSEIDYLRAVLEEADCDLLLDVNNLIVNACNHGYDPAAFLARVPAERVACLHVAGHYDEAPDLKIDTHGAPVQDDVWHLLGSVYQHVGAVPTLLERDFNFPPLAELLGEVDCIRDLQAAARPLAVRHG
ncbi:MAG: DUF692 domain-containing protein [Candidatus Pseudomonas phytovorans]|uniref:UPF0276 protein P0Y58_11975 n=1 Tax=Candidatus Pseudomonas phytovorans TaxID=3121377 RepID=A0AAJ6BFA4_9PSED|nr:DUF692 domain-containing protein [Pseudomonas sp.]WEK32871.1 MAG: DUF692 domain-containing protein [Pseudomonas sp.]